MSKIEINKEDIEKYKEKIEYWKALRAVLIKHKDNMSEEQLKSFTDIDGDILDSSINDDKILVKAKKVYEYVPNFMEKDLKEFEEEIKFIKENYKEMFNSDKEIVLTLKTYINEIKKNMFEENIKNNWEEEDNNLRRQICERAKNKGWFLYE